MRADETIELYDVQGNILNGYGAGHALYLMVGATSTGAARRCVATMLDRVTSAAPWRSAPPRSMLNLAVSYAGFQRLGLPSALLERFPRAFRESPRARARELGDVGPSAPDGWDAGLGSGAAHLMVTVNAQTREDLEAERARLAALLEASDGELVRVHEQQAHALEGKREHFGYADGFAQPDVEGVRRRSGARAGSTRGHGVPLPGRQWRPLKAGEFLLGYEDEDGQVDTSPSPALTRNGSYVVYRKLYQDVARFRSGLRSAAEESGLPEEMVAAKVVGRWRDGVPLSTSPERELAGNLSDAAHDDPPNDFRYLPTDAEGFVCPRGAHIRRVNPRDALGDGRLTARHRIIRRGMPYGPPLGSAAADDGEDRGLVFICYNADIERQFETVQQQWCNDGDAFGLGDDRDYLLGDDRGTGKMTIPGRGCGPRFIDAQPDIVQTRGTEYLFAPGLAALDRLATARWQ